MQRYILIYIPLILLLAYSPKSTYDAILDDGPQFADILFVENLGQWDAPHQFEAQLGGSKLFIEKNRLVYTLIDPETLPAHTPAEHIYKKKHGISESLKGHNYRVNFLNSNPHTNLLGQNKKDFYHNYFLGNDESKWKSNVPIFDGVLLNELYDGVNMKMYQSHGQLKYDFVVLPNADETQIKLDYEGADDVFIRDGHLHVRTSVMDVIEKAPYAYQFINNKKIEVACNYILKNNEVTFEFPNGFNKKVELIIDPVLIFSTYTGSFPNNFGVSATFDSQGNGYAAGTVFGFGYPTTVGAFDSSFDGDEFETTDLGVSKFNPVGTNLIYSTYIGGTEIDVPHSLIVNSRDELVIFGTTSSINFPVLGSSFDNMFNGGNTEIANFSLQFINGSDLFVSVLSSAGNNLLGSTYIGGSRNDGINNSVELKVNYADEFRGEVITDEDDNIYVATTTTSTDFPTTTGAFNENHNGGTYDAVVFKLNTNVSQLLWSTYFGGNGNDIAYSMKIDDVGNLFFAGGTASSDLPTNTNSIRPNYSGGVSDGYIARLNNNGSSLLASTYLGAGGEDQAYFVELDPEGQVYALGNAQSGNYPVTPGRYSIPQGKHFIHKLNPDLDSTYFSTTIGNGSSDGLLALNAFMIDDCYRIYFSGWGGEVNTIDPNNPVSTTTMAGFPISADAYQSVTDGSDFYFLVLKPNASDIQYGTYFGEQTPPNVGGEHVDGGTSRFDRRGIIYQAVCASCGGTTDFPTTPGAHSTVNETINNPNVPRGCNLALIKFDFQLDEIAVDANVNPSLTGCAPFDVQFSNFSRGPIDIFEWDFGDGATSDQIAPSHVYAAGTHNIMLIGRSEFACVDPDTAFLTVVVVDPSETTVETVFKCAEDDVLLTSKHISAGATYLWQDGSTNQNFSASDAGTYRVKTESSAGCFVDSFIVENFPIPSSSVDIEGCEPEDYVLRPPDINPPLQFLWSDGSSGTSLTARDAGIFWVQTLDPNNCDRIDSFIIDEYPLKDPIVEAFNLCPTKSTVLRPTDLTTPGITYQWSDGTTADSLFIEEPGTYVVVTNYPTECPLTDSFIVSPDSFPTLTLDSIRICEDSDFELSSQNIGDGATYLWSNGPTTPTITVGESGVFEVITDYDRICPSTNRYVVRAFPVIDENDIYVPNAFSPNNDGINDIFKPQFSPLVEVLNYDFKVFNRWGQKVFETDRTAVGWNGFEFDQPEAVAVYAWYCHVELISCTGDPLGVLLEGDVTVMK